MRARPSPSLALGITAALLSLLWSGWLAQWHLQGRASLVDRLEATLLDLRYLVVGPRRPEAGVVIVAIDDETVRRLGRYPLSRSDMARLVRELGRYGPKAVGLDILFLDAGPPSGDADLAAALNDVGAVIAAAGLFDGSGQSGGGRLNGAPSPIALPVLDRVLWPIDSLRRGTAAGLVNISTDHGGTPRHVPLLFRAPDALLPSFALRVASTATRSDPAWGMEGITIGPATISTDLGASVPIRFYGPRGSIPSFSAQAILEGKLPNDLIRDRIVVVGATAVGTGDTFTTPFDPVLPGVEVIATAISHLIHGDGLIRDTQVRRMDAVVAVGLSLGSVLILLLVPVSLALAVIGLATAGWLAWAAVAFHDGYWFSAALPLVALMPTAILTTLGRQVLDRRALKRHAAAEAAFRLFQPPALADRIGADPAYLMQPQEQLAAVLFIDLSRFTRLSERLGPTRTRELLREFHALVEDETDAAGGIALSYMGDGAMIAFGLPEPASSDARQALQAGFGLVSRARDWIEHSSRELAADIDVRVGGHFGPVVVSRLGAATHQHITVTGDTVNVASRLLEVAASEGASLVVSADLLAAAGDDAPGRSAFRSLQAVEIRGRREPLWVGLWSLGGSPHSPPAPDTPVSARRA